MTQFERALGDLVVPVIAVALIAAVVAAWASYRRTGRVGRSLAGALLTGSLVCVAGVVLQPAPGPAGIELIPSTNLGSPSGDDQIVANLLLMLPSGVALGLLRPLRRDALLGLAICAASEVLQAVLPIGRVAATEDFLLNGSGFSFGATIGGCARALATWARTTHDTAKEQG